MAHTLIDQRILIPAPTHIVWGILADPTHLTRWRADCEAVLVLTQRQFGVGMQRQIGQSGEKPRTEEITAWYEGLGYEYRLVEPRG
ncbi:MAG: SRPBCC family protein, partial [Anaerolineales bacterium]